MQFMLIMCFISFFIVNKCVIHSFLGVISELCLKRQPVSAVAGAWNRAGAVGADCAQGC
jgi:hypothetical protein